MGREHDTTFSAARPLSALANWHPICYQRAAAFVTDPGGRLLVFDHLTGDAGTQVPAGGIHEGESPERAVLRELAEESGIESAVVVRKLGEAWGRSDPGNVPAGLEEHIQHAFHLRMEEQHHEERWEWHEKSGGNLIEHRFVFRWVSLEDAARVLWPHQAMWIGSVLVSLGHL